LKDPVFSVFSPYPAVKFALPFALGILASAFFDPFLLTALSLLSSILVYYFKPSWIYLLLILFSGMLRMEMYSGNRDIAPIHCLQPDSLQYFVSSADRDSYRTRNYRLTAYDKGRQVGMIQLYRPASAPLLKVGNSYRFQNLQISWLKDVQDAGRRSGYEEYLFRKGYDGTARIRKNSRIDLSSEKPLLQRWLASLQIARFRMADDNLRRLGIRRGSLVNGLLLGLKKEIPARTADAFRYMGMSHVLAVSGLHAAFLILILYQIVRILQLPRALSTLLLLLMLSTYAALTGFTASVTRTLIMTAAVLGAPLCKRQNSSLNALAATAAAMLLLRPVDLMDAGFQLSFSAVAGILILYPPLKSIIYSSSSSFSNLTKAAMDLLLVSIAASLFTMPLTSFHFGTLPALGILLNILIIPLTFLLMGCGILMMLPLPHFIQNIFVHSADLSARLYLYTVELFSGQPFWILELPLPEGPARAFAAALMALLSLVLTRIIYRQTSPPR